MMLAAQGAAIRARQQETAAGTADVSENEYADEEAEGDAAAVGASGVPGAAGAAVD